YKLSGGEMVDSELGMIPKGWEVKCISEVCYFNKSSYTNKDSWEYINYLDTANITTNEINEIQRIDCSVDKIPSRAKRKVEKDSLVYSTVRPNQLHYGMIKKPVENMLVSTGFVVLDSKSTFLKNDLIYYWLIQEDNTEKLQAIAETTTSTYPSIKATDIKNMKIVLPTKELLLELSSKFGQINSYINSLQEESSTLKGIRETSLPKLMSGELRVTDL
ncbi:MAG: restriction endonuclease subunit S, partial [Niameybacter sp.]